MLSFATFFYGVISMSVCGANADNQPPISEYLSDVLLYRVPLIQQSWGELGIDTAVHAPGKTPMSLCIADKQYDKGLGTHAPGEIAVELDGEYIAFEAEVGVQKQPGDNVGSVVFQVFVDGEKRFDSGVMRGNDPAIPISISVAGAYELRLVVTDAGDGITCDCSNWADARLIRDPSVETGPPEEPLDIVPFARIVTWDPDRTDGCRCSRVEEFPAEEVFLESDVPPATDGTYTLPVASNGSGCIGLQWFERRRLRELALQFADGARIPSPDGAQVQAWFGESLWQGNWEPLKGTIEQQEDRWIFSMNLRDNPKISNTGTEKIRWIFPKSPDPVVLQRLSAFTYSRWGAVELLMQLENPLPSEFGEIAVYNGAILEPIGSGSSLQCSWDLSAPIRIKLRYSKPGFRRSDRTIIRFQLPTGAFGVAMDDVLAHGCVYVRALGVFVTCKPEELSLAEYRERISQRRTVLQKVRSMPDQTFQQAMEKVHREVQDNGPTMLSMACDNHKFVVQQTGAVRFGNFELVPEMASGKIEHPERHLHGGWLPVPVTTVKEDGIIYRQRTFVVPYDKAGTQQDPQPLCVAEFTIENPLSDKVDVSLKLKFTADAEQKEPAQLQQTPQGAIVQWQGQLLAFANTEEASGLQVGLQSDTLVLSGAMPAQTRQRCYVYIPAWEMKPEEHSSLKGGEELLPGVEAYWQNILSSVMQIEIPDPLLLNVIRVSQVHCLMAARNAEGGKLIEPWIASMSYGPLESEGHSIIRGMDLMGHHEFARRGLDFFIRRYNPEGFLTTGYTLMGTGWHLWTLGEHYQLTRDSDWMKRVAQDVAKVCRWIAQQRKKTMKLDADGKKVPECGLMPPGVIADWNRFAYRFFMEGNYCAGLLQAARALADVGHPDGASMLQDGKEFRQEILRAYRWVQARSPVLPLSDGTWVPAYPAMLYCFGLAGDIFAGEDWNRSWAGDVETGSHHLVPLGILEPNSQDAVWINEHTEDFWFLQTGMGEYPGDESQKDWFSLGGFAKVQPYYGRTAEIYALQDEVKPFIRSYFNAIPSLLNTENLSFWEHFHNIGAWNKTHETGSFLQQTRFLFVMERDDELWLAPFITNNWMKDGMVVSVRNAPTRFGKVSYRITSSIEQGFIEALIEPPARTTPEELVIRLRHPEEKPIRRVTVNGVNHTEFDSAKECIRIKPLEGVITVRAEY